jgi:hypothetical protein
MTKPYQRMKKRMSINRFFTEYRQGTGACLPARVVTNMKRLYTFALLCGAVPSIGREDANTGRVLWYAGQTKTLVTVTTQGMRVRIWTLEGPLRTKMSDVCLDICELRGRFPS